MRCPIGHALQPASRCAGATSPGILDWFLVGGVGSGLRLGTPGAEDELEAGLTVSEVHDRR